ncbi:conserved hypothetical protein [Methylocella silvestris BL2]|uniref:KAP NTPase domain-containing protein n=1 Tax=Methylocella silvestris (strain DSM 15510 / CIP 108128 / LMG 27833 / NCIMB 13906 / BL2) TaxID=395965 RepID=B8ELA0_METSB|nr:hypothetical protein [Methylocella silvestris]ACK49095.1 conserved hypothetical protein [Methylocella silvestris BL2]
MPDIGLRNLGSLIPGAKAEPPPAAPKAGSVKIEPKLSGALPPGPTPAPAKSVAATTRPKGESALFAADVGDDSAALGPADAPLALLAELALHRRTQTPFSIGLLGPSGSGKSVALSRLIEGVERLAAAARGATSSPFLANILTLRVDAADLDGPAATALAGALYARLALDQPQLAVEASHAARDPGLATREAFERLDSVSRKLESERRLLEEADGRRARLTDTVLYETPGSKIDAFAARTRGRIAATMSRFGAPGDPLLAYKDRVRTLADARGPSRLGFFADAFWGLKGQSSRIVWAIIFALAGFGLGVALAHQATWLDWLRAQPQMAVAAEWIAAHIDWLATFRGAFYVGAGLMLLSNLWRGLRLLRLVFRGEQLLNADLLERRREADAFLGHQSRRVQDLASEVDRLSRKAAEAERRAGGLNIANPALAEPSPFAADLIKQQAQRFLAAVGALVQKQAEGAEAKSSGPSGGAAQRIILALDNLDLVPAARALEILSCAPGPGFVSLIAVNPARFADAEIDLEKWISAPFSIGELAARRDPAAQVHNLLSASSEASNIAAPDAARCALDEPLSDFETRLLAALAPVAGPSARRLKRFVNLYRLLRAQWPNDPERRACLALALALDAGGTKEDLSALEAAVLAPGEPVFDHHRVSQRLGLALQAAATTQARLTSEALCDALDAARLFSFNG